MTPSHFTEQPTHLPANSLHPISLDKKNIKAYLRRGTAREMLGYYKEAIEGVLILYTYC